MGCNVYKRMETFRSVRFQLAAIPVCIIFRSNVRYYKNLCCITEQAEWHDTVVERTSGMLKDLGSFLSWGKLYISFLAHLSQRLIGELI